LLSLLQNQEEMERYDTRFHQIVYKQYKYKIIEVKDEKIVTLNLHKLEQGRNIKNKKLVEENGTKKLEKDS